MNLVKSIPPTITITDLLFDNFYDKYEASLNRQLPRDKYESVKEHNKNVPNLIANQRRHKQHHLQFRNNISNHSECRFKTVKRNVN